MSIISILPVVPADETSTEDVPDLYKLLPQSICSPLRPTVIVSMDKIIITLKLSTPAIIEISIYKIKK